LLKARLQPPLIKESSSGGPNLVVSRLALVGGVQTSFLALGVILGRGGGRSIWSIITYRELDLKDTVDERREFPGFYQPGNAEIAGVLDSVYTVDTLQASYDIRSGLDARAGEQARLICCFYRSNLNVETRHRNFLASSLDCLSQR